MTTHPKVFQAAYYIGIGTAVLVAVSALFIDAAHRETLAKGLFFIGIPHMVILTVIGILLPRESVERTRAGGQIGLAGYLHTLIGFSVIMTLLGQAGEFSVALVLGPLGSALITSIIGWFVGGELTGRTGESESDVLRAEAEKVAAELSGFSSAVRRTHEDYIRSVKALHSGYEDLETANKVALVEVKDVSARIASSVAGVSEAVKQLESELRKASDALAGSLTKEFKDNVTAAAIKAGEVKEALGHMTGSANESAKYLKEARILITELERVVGLVVAVKSREA